MRTYLVAYELPSSPPASFALAGLIGPQNLDALIQKIKSYGPWARPLDSVWIIRSEKDAMAIARELQALIRQSDRLIVLEISSGWATVNGKNDVIEWLRKVVAA